MQTKSPTFFTTFGKALKYYLKSKGIKQSYLVKKTGKGKDEISNYVNDKVEPKEKSQQMIEEVLGVSFVEETPNKWVIRSQNGSDPVQEAIDAVDRVEEEQGRYTASKQFQDDPEKLLQLSQLLIDMYLKEIQKK